MNACGVGGGGELHSLLVPEQGFEPGCQVCTLDLKSILSRNPPAMPTKCGIESVS